MKYGLSVIFEVFKEGEDLVLINAIRKLIKENGYEARLSKYRNFELSKIEKPKNLNEIEKVKE